MNSSNFASGEAPLSYTLLSYEASIAYMSGLLQFGIRLDRERFVELLARLGDPHLYLRDRAIHVAGTNGKGSTTTFIASILRAAGYKVGAYLSPYVFDLRERIQINGEIIPREDFARHISAIRPHVEAIAKTELGPTTEFELKTAAAFLHFAEQEVDFAVIEVGIGGRLDATNIITSPLVAVITQIGLDHQKILGDTIEEIAGEKAGILKPGTVCVTGVAPGGALETIREKAASISVPVLRIGQSEPAGRERPANDEPLFASYTPNEPGGRSFTLSLPGVPPESVHLSLQGGFQWANATVAAAATTVLEQKGIAIGAAAIREGLQKATLPGRFQIVRGESGSNPNGSGKPALILDVAHNEDGARVLREALQSLFPNRPCTFVVGMSKMHEPEEFLRHLMPVITRLVATAPNFRPKPVEEVAAAARTVGIANVEIREPAAVAIREVWNAAVGNEVVVVTGSFYTVGETPEELRLPL